MYRYLLVVFAAIALAGCATTVLESKTFKSYKLGEEVNASVGGVLLVNQDGTIQKVKRWVGVANAPGGWEIKDEYSQDFVKKELLYSGKSGSVIEIGYREYRGGLAAPAFYQAVKYDLSESNIVGFQNFRIRVIRADNASIQVVILSDRPDSETMGKARSAEVQGSAYGNLNRPVPKTHGKYEFAAEKMAESFGCSDFASATLQSTAELYTTNCGGNPKVIHCDVVACKFME